MPHDPPLDAAVGASGMIRDYPGYWGAHTREEAAGAISNGARVQKTRSEPDDMNPLGAQGVVLGSLRFDGKLVYFIEWDERPRTAIAVSPHKISEI